MNVCSPQLGFSPKSILGGEIFDVEILTGLAKKGVKVNIILPKNLDHPAKKQNINYRFLPVAHFPPILFNILVIPYLLIQNKKDKIQILRLHQPQFLIIPSLVLKLFNPTVKIIATYHQFRESSFWIFAKLINNFWDIIICDSETAKKKLIDKYSIDHTKIIVVHNGVPKYLHPENRDKRLANTLKLKNKKVLLFMGRFINRKNPLFMLDVLSILIKKNQDVSLLFWGDGPLKNKIQKKAEQLDLLSNVVYIKPQWGKVKNNIHNLADIFVHPSLDEGFALAPLESMACGKPVIMNDCHSAREAVKSGYNGLLCKTNDVQSWSDAIIKLLNDKNTLKRYGKNAQKKTKLEFNWDKSVDLHYEVFKRVIS